MAQNQQPALDLHAYDNVCRRCLQMQRAIKQIHLFLKLKKNQAPELKLVTLVEKIQLLVMGLNQGMQMAIDEMTPSPTNQNTPPMTDVVKKTIDDTRTALDEICELVVMDLSDAVDKLCNPDSIVNRLSQKLDEVIFNPDLPIGQQALSSTRANFDTLKTGN